MTENLPVLTRQKSQVKTGLFAGWVLGESVSQSAEKHPQTSSGGFKVSPPGGQRPLARLRRAPGGVGEKDTGHSPPLWLSPSRGRRQGKGLRPIRLRSGQALWTPLLQHPATNSKKAQLCSYFHSPGTILDTQFPVNVLHVKPYSPIAELQSVGNLLVAQTGSHKLQYLQLSVRQR